MSAHVWMPIGSSSRNFQGNFDGNGFEISGLTTMATSSYVGLFGYISNGTIQNVSVVDSVIQGSGYVGAIVGHPYSSEIINCKSSCQVSATGQYCGGIVGYASSAQIKYCQNNSTVTSTADDVGGIVGYASSTDVRYCANTANIAGNNNVGGIAGTGATRMQGLIQDCYNTGNVTATGDAAGGIAGRGALIATCYNTGAVTGLSAGGICNFNSIFYAINCLNLGEVKASSQAYQGGIGSLPSSVEQDEIAASLLSFMMYSGDYLFFTSSYYGGNCGDIGSVNSKEYEETYGGEYSQTLAQDARNIDFYTNLQNWDLRFYWDFENVWQFVEGENDGLPVLKESDHETATVLIYSMDGALTAQADWMGPQKAGFVYGGDPGGVLYANLLLKKVKVGDVVGSLPNTSSDTDFTFINYYKSTEIQDENIVTNQDTEQMVVDEDIMLFAYFELNSTWEDHASTSLTTQGDAFLIKSAEDLAFVANQVSQGFAPYTTASYVQTQDLDLSAHYWFPIGTQEHPFAGNYDGGGYTISGLKTYTIDRLFLSSSAGGAGSVQPPVTEDNPDYAGLFGYVIGQSASNKAVIQNIGIIDSAVSAYFCVGSVVGYGENISVYNCYCEQSKISSYGYAGGIMAACISGEIINCYSSCNWSFIMGSNGQSAGIAAFIRATTINRCYNTGNIFSGAAAGIAIMDCNPFEDDTSGSVMPSTITNCYNTGSLFGALITSGILAMTNGAGTRIDNCYNTGMGIGIFTGAAGICYGGANGWFSITNCYNTGTLMSGLIGGAGIVVQTSSACIIANNFNIGELPGKPTISKKNAPISGSSKGYFAGNYYNNVGENIEDLSGATYSPTLADDAKTEAWYSDGALWDPAYPWNIGEDWFIVDGYPTLEEPITWLDDPSYYDYTTLVETGDGSESNPFVITTNKQLAGMAYLLREHNADYKTKHFKLDANVDMSEYYWVPIGTSASLSFSGSFDGNGHVISGIKTFSSWDGGGLFGTVIGTSSAPAQIKNVVIENSSTGGGRYGGGVVGLAEYANISGCRAQGDSKASGTYAGGVVGFALNSTISNCYNDGALSLSADYMGGVVGYANLTTVTNCYGSINSSLNASAISVMLKADAGHVGGVIGCAENTSIANSFNAGNVSATNGIVVESHSISGIPLTFIYAGGVVGTAKTNTTIENCYNLAEIYCQAFMFAAGVAGKVDSGIIKNCYNKGDIIAKEEYSMTSGVLAVLTNGQILNCTNYGNIPVNIEDDKISTIAAGIVGMTIDYGLLMLGAMFGTPFEDYLATLSQSTIDNCVNYGNVTGDSGCSGIISMAYKCDIINCINAGQIGAQIENDLIGGSYGTGIVSQVMSDLSLENCFNFGDIISEHSGGIVGQTSSFDGSILNISLNHCFNAGKLYALTNYGGAGGLIYDMDDANLTITNSANVGDIEVFFTDNSSSGSIDIGGIMAGAPSSLTISNCLVDMDVSFTVEESRRTVEVSGITNRINISNLSISNCAIRMNINAEGEFGDENVGSFYLESTFNPADVIENSYSLVTNSSTGTQTNVVLDNGGLDGNFVYQEGMFGGMAVPVNLYHIDDYITSTGILTYLQQTFNVQPYAAA